MNSKWSTVVEKIKAKHNMTEEDAEAYLQGIEDTYFLLDDKIEQLKIRKDLW